MRIVVTGTPGTGKTTLAKQLAAKMHAPLFDVNKIAVQNKLYKKERGTAEKIVDIKKLSALLRKKLARETSFVAEGHLACEFALPADFVIVLRCNPLVLEKRLKKRKYPARKIEENKMAEFLDYCLVNAEQNYAKSKAKILQIDATKFASAQKALRLSREGKGGAINWMPILQRQLARQ